MNTTIVGYPRIGKMRELKFVIEKYWIWKNDRNRIGNSN